jgi:hypothetical protein
MKRLLFLIAVFASLGHAQTPVSLSPVARQQFLNATGQPLAGGKLCTYAAGTSTPQATYVDSSGTIMATNPILLDAAGEASIWLAGQSYKFVLFTAGTDNTCSTGVQQWMVDFVSDPGFIKALNAVLLTGNQTVAGNKTFSNITIFPSGSVVDVNGPINITNALLNDQQGGTFTNLQTTDYILSQVNLGPLFGGAGFATEAIVGSIGVPSYSTTAQADGIAGYASTQSTSTNTMGGYFKTYLAANNSSGWGIDALAIVDPALNPTIVHAVGSELDIDNNSGTDCTIACTSVDGLDVISKGTNKATSGISVSASGAGNHFVFGEQIEDYDYVGIQLTPPADNANLQMAGTNAANSANTWTIDNLGRATFQGLYTTSHCVSSTSPAVCNSAASGAVAIAAGSGSLVVGTSAVTANSQIQLTFDESLGTLLSVTCNTSIIQPIVGSRTAGSGFTIVPSAGIVTNPACISYTIVN